MQLGELFQTIHGTLLEEDLIPIAQVTEEQLKQYHMPEKEKILKMIEYLEKDVNDFYIYTKGMIPLVYFKTGIIIDIHSISKDYIDNFDVRERIEKSSELVEEAIKENDFNKVLAFADKKIAFLTYKKLFPLIPDNKKYPIFKELYTRLEYGFSNFDKNFIEEILKHRKNYNKKAIKQMADDGYITIYRGVTSQSTPLSQAYSWTTQINSALFFASRFNTSGDIYTAKVHVDKVIDYLTNRNESEILVRPEDVIEPRKMELYKFNDIMYDLQNSGIIEMYHNYCNKIDDKHYKNPSSIHGVLHAKRVLLLTLMLSHYKNLNNTDTHLLAKAAIYHDIGRNDDENCLVHGQSSIDKMLKLKIIKNINTEENQILKYIIDNHCIDDKDAYINIKQYNIENNELALKLLRIFKDADGLDRVRISDLNINYLREPESKQMVMIAQELLYGIK